ncbi:MAG TPA: 3-deoxy-D-manno-octulosonic acid kinase [Gammaproteobacteria bacterium]|nr:3-deoxy-D-manno-octulosonic acid kinase [Gammaproteobacteria bacterium]
MGHIVRFGEGRAILADEAFSGQPAPELFSPAAWHARGAVVRPTHGGRGASWFVSWAGEEWVLRHYRRGGFFGPLLRDRYFWQGEAAARPFREWWLLAKLHAAGLPVPRPLAAQIVRSGVFYRGDILTERLAALPLSQLLAHGAIDEALWRRVGACVRRFHDANVWHADLNAHNVLIGKRGEVFLIDFDRARLRTAGGRWRVANLERLARSLRKLLGAAALEREHAAGWRALMEGYGK